MVSKKHKKPTRSDLDEIRLAILGLVGPPPGTVALRVGTFQGRTVAIVDGSDPAAVEEYGRKVRAALNSHRASEVLDPALLSRLRDGKGGV